MLWQGDMGYILNGICIYKVQKLKCYFVNVVQMLNDNGGALINAGALSCFLYRRYFRLKSLPKRVVGKTHGCSRAQLKKGKRACGELSNNDFQLHWFLKEHLQFSLHWAAFIQSPLLRNTLERSQETFQNGQSSSQTKSLSACKLLLRKLRCQIILQSV